MILAISSSTLISKFMVVVEQGMQGSLQEGPQPIQNYHQPIGRGEAEHVDEEVPGQLPVLLVVEEVAGVGSQHHQEEHEDPRCWTSASSRMSGPTTKQRS